ncbi:putative 4-phosphopantetheinyl transferase EntD [Escherichia coli 2-177-06_S3_C2]|nr:putative 4-phosphopantetheinyl transferase EntD [Escherichia coli 1-110-08_S1_C1]KDW28597.1 putative 4-phosphopantetheinyl transferase EntD [Escherichia coli 2-156-04_S3_C2]KDX42521.1 putative 4-phosphopantetheinyl transferase EntD [Escherichia coli 2-177-06_S3_C2]KEO06674.1 putative 4-phosphopantetheinyl transferase EntD [Escherichia coli 2-177-06_S3_C3]
MRFVHAGCGVNALSSLQKHANSIDCRDYVGLISVAHQAILRL